jgi:MoxR-like ATPase
MSELEFEKFKNYIEQYLVGEEQQIEIIYTGLQAAKLSNTVPAFLLRGPPGAGKTAITKLIADYFNANYVFIQATLNTTEDELIYKYIPSEQTRSGIKILYGPLPEALEKSKDKMTVLVIDEFDKTRPSTDALLLDYLQNARVSFKLDDTEKILEGNKNNLVIFLTSNDNREFSEPLLRRVIVVDFQPPNPKAVEQLLKKEFGQKIVKLLVNIYSAGLRAGLNKPVTIQELVQFAYALQIMPNASFNDLLYSFVVKNDGDIRRLAQALNNSEQEQEYEEKEIPDVAQALVQHQKEQELQEHENEQEHEQTAQEVLAHIKVPENTPINAEKITSTEERDFLATISKNFKEYSNIITTFEPEPAERPDVLGKFQVVLDETELKLTASTPLTLEEVYKLLINKTSNFEAYIEDKVYLTYEEIINIAKTEKLNFKYYTKSLIILQKNTAILRFEKIKNNYFVLRMYVNVQNTNEEKQLLGHLYSYQPSFRLTEMLNSLQWKFNEITNGKYFNSNEYKQLIEFLETTNINAKLIIEINPYLYIVTMHGKPEIRYTITNDAHDNFVKFVINRIDIVTEKTSSSDIIKTTLNKYAGTYDIPNGLQVLKQMAEEINNLIQ